MIGHLKSATRRTVLWLLRKFNPGDIRIRHHYTGTRLMIDAFKHKGYWFHGKRRESATMQLIGRIVKPGDKRGHDKSDPWCSVAEFSQLRTLQ